MRLNKRSEYGLRAAVHLAANFERGYLRTHQISRREKLPQKFLESILRRLKEAGLVESKVGSAGGHRLADRPERITVGRLLRALEGDVIQAELLRKPADVGVVEPGRLAVHLLARRVQQSVTAVIDTCTLADLLEEVHRAQSRSQSMYYI